jgi:hypothetical protein
MTGQRLRKEIEKSNFFYHKGAKANKRGLYRLRMKGNKGCFRFQVFTAKGQRLINEAYYRPRKQGNKGYFRFQVFTTTEQGELVQISGI